jgi:hypothetical protein
MATQGLFTKGPTVEDLLEKRNKRATDLQQTLMANAGKRARDPAKAQAISFLGSTLGRALGNASGGEDTILAKRRADIAQQEEMQTKFGNEYTSGKPETQLKLANELIQMGEIQAGTQLFDIAQAGITKQKEDKAASDLKIKEQARREQLEASARKFGLTSLADDLRSGSDMDDAAAIIAEKEKVTMLAGGNRKTRAAMARRHGKSPEYIKEILAGVHDDVSDDMFIKALEGKEAKLVNYKNSEGGIQLYRVDNEGKVWNNPTQSWVYPSELGLSAAPKQTQEIVPMLDTITAALVGAEVENYGELNTRAYKAVDGIYINDQSMDIFDKGIILGKFGEMRLQIAKGLEALGMSSERANEVTANTEAYLAYRGNAVANIIQAFGAGTGLSDQDRKYATAMAGGEIEMSALAVKKILEIERKMYINHIELNNEAVSRMIGRTKGASADKKKLALSYYIAIPSDRLSEKTEQQSIVDKWVKRAGISLSTRQLGAQ